MEPDAAFSYLNCIAYELSGQRKRGTIMFVHDRSAGSQSAQTPALLKSFPHHNFVPKELDFVAKCNLLGRRIGAAAAVFTFVACYIYGIVKFGLLAGIGLGWLPASFLAWVAIIVIAPLSTKLIWKIVGAARYLASLTHSRKLHAE